MTEGAVLKNILLFALPLMLGNIFQQLYNTVDSIVVGNFVGKEALAAVGTTDSIINTFIGFFSGLATGSGINLFSPISIILVLLPWQAGPLMGK